MKVTYMEIRESHINNFKRIKSHLDGSAAIPLTVGEMHYLAGKLEAFIEMAEGDLVDIIG